MPTHGKRCATYLLSIIGCIGLYLSSATSSRADRIDYFSKETDWQHTWGTVISMNNDYIEFRVGCSGQLKRIDWSLFDLNVVFTDSCEPSKSDVQEGGEPIDCTGTKGRWFRLIGAGKTESVGREEYWDFIDYRNEILTIGMDGATAIERSPRKDGIMLTLMCDQGVGASE